MKSKGDRMDKLVDPKWTIHNDLLSVHVGINSRLRVCHLQKLTPTCILIGRKHTQLFMKELGEKIVPRGVFRYGPDEIPVHFNVRGLYGIACETMPREPKPPKPRKKKNSQ